MKPRNGTWGLAVVIVAVIGTISYGFLSRRKTADSGAADPTARPHIAPRPVSVLLGSHGYDVRDIFEPAGSTPLFADGSPNLWLEGWGNFEGNAAADRTAFSAAPSGAPRNGTIGSSHLDASLTLLEPGKDRESTLRGNLHFGVAWRPNRPGGAAPRAIKVTFRRSAYSRPADGTQFHIIEGSKDLWKATNVSDSAGQSPPDLGYVSSVVKLVRNVRGDYVGTGTVASDLLTAAHRGGRSNGSVTEALEVWNIEPADGGKPSHDEYSHVRHMAVLASLSGGRPDGPLRKRTAMWVELSTAGGKVGNPTVIPRDARGTEVPHETRSVGKSVYVFFPWGYDEGQRELRAEVNLAGRSFSIRLPRLPAPKRFPPIRASGAWPGLSVAAYDGPLPPPFSSGPNVSSFLVYPAAAPGNVSLCRIIGSSTTPYEPDTTVLNGVGGGPLPSGGPSVFNTSLLRSRQTDRVYVRVTEYVPSRYRLEQAFVGQARTRIGELPFYGELNGLIPPYLRRPGSIVRVLWPDRWQPPNFPSPEFSGPSFLLGEVVLLKSNPARMDGMPLVVECEFNAMDGKLAQRFADRSRERPSLLETVMPGSPPPAVRGKAQEAITLTMSVDAYRVVRTAVVAVDMHRPVHQGPDMLNAAYVVDPAAAAP